MVGKPWSYETDDGETKIAVRPELITQVDESTRDRWVVETADQTTERLEAFDAEANDYAQMAHDEYGERLSPYREAAIEALESLDATDASAAAATSEAAVDAAGSDSSAGDAEQIEVDAEAHTSTETGESVESEESSSDELSGPEESSEDTGLGEYE